MIGQILSYILRAWNPQDSNKLTVLGLKIHQFLVLLCITFLNNYQNNGLIITQRICGEIPGGFSWGILEKLPCTISVEMVGGILGKKQVNIVILFF